MTNIQIGIGPRPTVFHVFFVVALLNASMVARAQTRTVVTTGDTVPGVNNGADFGGFYAPVVNSSGQVAFLARHSDLVGGFDQGIWSEQTDSLKLVAHSRFPLSGDPNAQIFDFSARPGLPHITSDGSTVFVADNATSEGVWVNRFGTLLPIIQQGDDLPGDQVLHSLQRLRVSGSGLTAITGVDGTMKEGIWIGDSESIHKVARVGDQVPGLATGVLFRDNGTLGMFEPSINTNGQVAFRSTFTGSASSLVDNAIILASKQTFSVLARAGDTAVDTTATFESFLKPRINDEGKVAFIAELHGTDVTPANDIGIWAGSHKALRLLARSGQPAPGVEEAATFETFEEPFLNERGRTAFFARLRGPGIDYFNEAGIWSSEGDNLELVVRSGQPAVGVSPNVNLQLFFGSTFFSSNVVMNGSGQIAFAGGLSGPDVNFLNDFGIWAQDLNGNLQLIAREGDTLEISSGEIRTISSLSFVGQTGNQDGSHSRFNDLGQLAFTAQFTDGTAGVFVSNIVAVPEPTAGIVIAVAFLGSILRMRNGNCT